MNPNKIIFKDIDDYISNCKNEVQPILKKLRATIKKAAPQANEYISYGMPFYEYGGKGFKGRLIYFAAFNKHISLFIPPIQSESFINELQKYHVSKATYQFPLNNPLPFNLIEKTVKALILEKKLQLKLSKLKVKM
ncbi:MAG: DUF1801 domain-containing protein [Alphaproteobacteria bacterium]|nr:DUF1801 domain-containing protein [Alphaproteobacteria bacterium]